MAVKLYTPDANVIVHETKVDFRRRVVQRQINLVQYDKSMPVIAVQLCSNGNEYVLPENSSAYIRFGKRDHTYVYNECLGCDQTRTIVYFAITDQMTVFYGEHTPIVELRIGDTVAGSGSIPIWIDRNPIQNGDTESKSDLSVFEKAIEAAQKINVKLPTDLKATATNLSLLAGSAKIGSGINLSGFEYDEATNTLKASGGGGASVSPCLNLMNMSGEQTTVRTSITEEEKNNIEKGLYNSVVYSDPSSDIYDLSRFFPETAMIVNGNLSFSTYNFSVDETANKVTILGSSSYDLVISGEKSEDGTYPITIEKMDEATFGGGGGGASVSPCLNLLDTETQGIRTSITEEELLNLEDGLYNSVLYFDKSDGQFAFASMAFPEPLTTQVMDIPSFSIFNLAVDTNTNKITITGSSMYGIAIGDKNADGNYPIRIQKMEEATFGGGGGGAIQEIEAIKNTGGRSGDNQYTLSSTPTSSMFIMKVKNYDGVYSRFTMILQSLNKSHQAYFGFKIDSLSPDSNTCVYAYSEGTTAILSNQCYLPPEIKSGDIGKVLIARDYGYNLEDLPSSLPNISQSDIGKYLVVGNNQEASWQNLPESTSTIIRRW